MERIYQWEELTPAAEARRSAPPWWLHAILFLLVFALAAAASLVQQELSADDHAKKVTHASGRTSSK